MSEFRYNLQSLLGVLQEIKDASYGETKINVFKKEIVLGLLTAEEQTKVHEYCSQFKNRLAYILNYQIEVLSYAIKALGGERFGSIQLFPTGEYDESGNEIKKQKNVFWREVINSWNVKIRDRLFDSYVKFEESFNENIEETIEFAEPPKQEIPDYEDLENQKPKLEKVKEGEPAAGPPVADGSFSMPESEEEIPMYDDKGNLTAEGRIIQDFFDREKKQEHPPGVITVDEPSPEQEDLPEETSEGLDFSGLSDEEVVKQLKSLIPGGGDVRQSKIQDLSEVTQIEEENYPEKSEEKKEIAAPEDAKKAANAFQKNTPKKPTPKPAFKRQNEKPASKAELIKQIKAQQERENVKRDSQFDDDRIQLTSDSQFLREGELPPGVKGKKKK